MSAPPPGLWSRWMRPLFTTTLLLSIPVLTAVVTVSPSIAPSPALVLRALVPIAVLALVLVAGCRIVPDKPCAATAAATAALLMAAYPAFARPSSDFHVSSDAALVVLSIAAALLVARLPDALTTTLDRALTGFAVAYLLLATAALGVAYGKGHLLTAETHRLDLVRPIALTADDASKPDIYHLLLDGFGRADVLRERYGVDLSPLIARLESQGAQVEAGAVANYAQTYLSVASMLNAMYLDALGRDFRDTHSRVPAKDLIQHSVVADALVRAGYEFQFIGSGYSATASHPLSSFCDCDYPLIGEFESYVLRFTPFGSLIPASAQYAAHRSRIRGTLEQLVSLPPSDRPRFLFAHVMAPHPPFVFDKAGAARTPGQKFSFFDGSIYPASDQDYRDGYGGQAAYVAQLIPAILDRMVAASASAGREAVVVINGDHGPRLSFDARDTARTDPREVLPVFLAIRWPPGSDGTGVQVGSPVNIYRAILSQYFGARLDLLDDRSMLSSFDKPYDFLPVDPAILAARSSPGRVASSY